MTIKELRKEKGLTQAAFAQSIGVSVPSIGGYEADRIHPSAKVLEKIKEVYGVEIAADTSEKSIKKETKKAGRKIKVDKKKAPSKKKPEKKDSDEPDVAPATKEKKPAKRGKKKVNTPVINIQSPLGGSIRRRVRIIYYLHSGADRRGEETPVYLSVEKGCHRAGDIPFFKQQFVPAIPIAFSSPVPPSIPRILSALPRFQKRLECRARDSAQRFRSHNRDKGCD